jgi:uncharacterized protein (UPF0335 family)
MHHTRESGSQQSKSFINAMRALQEKCKRLELEKSRIEQESANMMNQLRSEGENARKMHSQLQKELEQRAVEAI